MPHTPISIPGFADPFSAISHLVGAALFLALGMDLVRGALRPTPQKIALSIYVLGVVFALAMSGVFHLLPTETTARAVLRRIDHAGIFFLIAATYTPVHIIQFRGLMRWGVLTIIWSAAITGIVLKSVFFESVPDLLSLSLYLTLGWAGILSAVALHRRYGWKPLEPLVFGALAYTTGAVLEFLRRPVLVGGVVGPHEVFHVFVLLGVACHWVYIRRVSRGSAATLDEVS